jgi:shikimate kinase
MEKCVFLVGYMGVGKSTLGKKLAQRLGVEFIDSDSFIENQIGISIADYFEQFGEENFRELERKFLLQLSESSCVVATGGGLPCFGDAMEVMNEKGITIYLHRPPKELFQRLKNAKKERPLIARLSEEELLEYITKQLKDREVFYSKAKFIVPRELHHLNALYEIIMS